MNQTNIIQKRAHSEFESSKLSISNLFRVRKVPHIEGNFASYICIDVSGESAFKALQNELAQYITK